MKGTTSMKGKTVDLQTSARRHPSAWMMVLRDAGPGFWLRAAAYSVAALLVLGVPTVLIPNQLFARMIEAPWWSYGLWAVAAILTGLVLATRTLPGAACPVQGRTAAGGGLAFLAVACPTCNVLVVSALGTSGALSLFAPVQPVLGIVGVGVLGWALWRIVRAIGANREEPGSR
jgi:hypothetical protein